jgi:hypothetical protein
MPFKVGDKVKFNLLGRRWLCEQARKNNPGNSWKDHYTKYANETATMELESNDVVLYVKWANGYITSYYKIHFVEVK